MIGYGCTYKMPQDGTIAVLPIGYYDGYPRELSNKSWVYTKGKKAPVVGRICMNMMMVDVSNIKGIKLEEEVELIGSHISTEEIAKMSGTINYEITTRIAEHVERKYI